MKYLLDMGHCIAKGSADTGCQGNGKREEDCTREIGYKIKSKLETLGHTVVICSCDSANSVIESLSHRTNTANKNGGDLYVAIHLNAGGGYGTEVFTYGAKAFPEAIRTLNNIVGMGLKNRGIKDGKGLYVINHTNMKSMLVECCFMDTNDMAKYNAEKFADCIVKGITGQAIKAPVVTKPVVAVKAANKGNIYRVITGSFSDETNADIRIKELKAKGFESFKEIIK